jgi:hypothetical protein
MQLRSQLETLRTDGRRVMSERLRAARADGDFDSNPALSTQSRSSWPRRIELAVADRDADPLIPGLRAHLESSPACRATGRLRDSSQLRDGSSDDDRPFCGA